MHIPGTNQRILLDIVQNPDKWYGCSESLGHVVSIVMTGDDADDQFLTGGR